MRNSILGVLLLVLALGGCGSEPLSEANLLSLRMEFGSYFEGFGSYGLDLPTHHLVRSGKNLTFGSAGEWRTSAAQERELLERIGRFADEGSDVKICVADIPLIGFGLRLTRKDAGDVFYTHTGSFASCMAGLKLTQKAQLAAFTDVLTRMAQESPPWSEQ